MVLAEHLLSKIAKIKYLTSNDQAVVQSKKFDVTNIAILITIWIFMMIAVNPIGNFPLNDDWAYARSVKFLVEKGDFQLSDWTATNLFSQVLWGALFSWPLGFSFTALRFSTLTLGLIGVLVTYGLLREVNANPKIAFCGALLVAANPIYFVLSNTFMNDVPFFGFATLSLYFLLRGLKYDSNIEVLIGVLLTCVAILTRQVGLAIPVAFGFAYVIKEGIYLSNLIKGFLPLVMGISVQLFYQRWLQSTGRLPYSYGDQIGTLFKEASQGVAHILFNQTQITLFSLIYLGLFLLPFLLLLFFREFKEISSKQRTLALLGSSLFFVTVTQILVSKNRLMPLMGNILVDFGLGFVGVINSYQPIAPRIFWLTVTAIGVIGAALLMLSFLFAVAKFFNKHPGCELTEIADQKWLTTFIMFIIFVYSFPLSILGLHWQGFYDRYMIILLPLLMMIIMVSINKTISQKVSQSSFFIALIMILPYGLFTIGATHDYLASSRVIWHALDRLVQESQISPDRINGGFEFNGWYSCNRTLRLSPDKAVNFACLWGNDNQDYLISFEPVTGYKEVERYSFMKWLPFEQETVLVLEKQEN